MTIPPLSRSHLRIGDIDCAYATFGGDDVAQPVILALHGWGASADLITPLAARLATKGFRIIAPDLPGFGESAPPPQTWSVYDYADHVLRFMDELNLERLNLFGHSFGGRLALVLGAQHPQRVSSIALSNSAGVPPHKDPIVQARTSLYKGVRDGLKAVGLTTLSDKLRDTYVARYASADYKSAGVLRDSFVKIVNEDLLPYAARVSAPTLLIWGAKDEDTPLWQGQKLQTTIPNAGIVVYDDAGHYSYLDRLGDVVATLDYFYKHPTGG
jgi:pimeloyl-ACP methyl ester carboxylesterase